MKSAGFFFESFVLLVGALLFLATCAAQEPGICHPESVRFPPVNDNLDVESLVNKFWYVQEIFVPEAQYLFEPKHDCFAQHIGSYMDPPNFGITHDFIETYTDLLNGTVHQSLKFGAAMENNTAVWVLVTNATNGNIETTVVTHTDSETYSVMYWCPWENESYPSERIMLLTGSPERDEGLLADLTGRVAAMGFPVNYGVQISHHANCTYE